MKNRTLDIYGREEKSDLPVSLLHYRVKVGLVLF